MRLQTLKKKESIVNELVTELESQNLASLADEVKEEAYSASLLRLYTTITKGTSALVALHTPLKQTGLITNVVLSNREKESLNKQRYMETLNEYLLNNSP